MNSKKFLEEVKPRVEEGERHSVYITESEWRKFIKNTGHLGASLTLEHFIRLFNEGMEKPDEKGDL